jgi:A/G-specific adenine glycosylase
MPWRKPWLDPQAFGNTDSKESFQVALAKRAYEVWVSEIMLQQTRVSVVISYFNNWISEWPTVQDLAAATQDDVLAAWKGLGYYSRATRLHEAAQQIVADMEGVIPQNVDDLLKIKGIGRYTAGAVSSIAFGRAVALLDGNVGRVLCRQLGLYARVKEKKIEDLLWEVAGILVENTAQHQSHDSASNVPGRWNQALMELGSTICTPKPKCDECPIQSTCRAYAEGALMAKAQANGKTSDNVMDIEDACHLCEPLEVEEVEVAVEENTLEHKAANTNAQQTRKRAATATALASRPVKNAKVTEAKQRSLRDFASFANPRSKVECSPSAPKVDASAQIVAYCSLFPKREPKKQVPEEECLVCIIQRDTDRGQQFLIEQRPPKGLLASLWQFPTHNFPAKTETTLQMRKAYAEAYVQELTDSTTNIEITMTSESGTITHVFSHLKLRMHVHAFTLHCEDNIARSLVAEDRPKRLWVDEEGVHKATLGTGMRRCWGKYLETGS